MNRVQLAALAVAAVVLAGGGFYLGRHAERGAEHKAASSGRFIGTAPPVANWQFVKGYWSSYTAEKKFWNAAAAPDKAYHNGMNNYLFCDGHVKARKPELQGYDITAGTNPQDNIWLVSDGRNGGPLPTTPK